MDLVYIYRANTGVVLSFDLRVEGPLIDREALDVWYGVENGNAKLCNPWRASRQTGSYLGG